MKNRPNFVFICTDQQRWRDLGCYGNSIIKTPNIDRLAKNGVCFQNGFTPAASCMPARASMITGLHPSVHRLNTMIDKREELPVSIKTLPAILAKNGYNTAAFGKLHLSRREPDRHSSEEIKKPVWTGRTEMAQQSKELNLPYYGYNKLSLSAKHLEIGDYDHVDEVRKLAPEVLKMTGPKNALEPPVGAYQAWKSAVPKEWYSTGWIGSKAVEYIENINKEEPFYMHVGFFDPHHPFCPPEPYCNMYPRNNIHNPIRQKGELAALPEPCWPWVKEDDRELSGLPDQAKKSDYIFPESHRREITALYYGMLTFIDDEVGRIVKALEQKGLLNDTIIIYTCDHGEYLGDHWCLGKGILHYDSLIHVPYIWWNPQWCSSNTRPETFLDHVDYMPTVLELAGCDLPENVQGRSYASVLKDGGGFNKEFIMVEDDRPKKDLRLRTFRSKEYRLTYFMGRDDIGEFYDLTRDPGEFNNLWHSQYHKEKRNEILIRLLDASASASLAWPYEY
ncbi:MAG: sulfatase-like hydrolase/transferase [bacterium]